MKANLLPGIRDFLSGETLLLIGWLLVTALLLQLVLLVWRMITRSEFERRRNKMTIERLRLQIQTARLEFQEVERSKLVWNGFRKFQVMNKTVECDNVHSFYLAPHDKRPLPGFKPGQYLTFQLNIPGQAKPVIRCYSLSDSPRHADYYRVTIKKVCGGDDQPPGLASCYFCDHLKVNDIVDVKAPAGHFFLDMAKERPAVLISAGVGITPMLSMVNAVTEARSNREVWFFFGARSGEDHIQKEHLQRLAARHENVRLQVCYSRPRPEDRLGEDFHHSGRVTIELLKTVLPSSNYDYFLCGPGAFMKSITDGLTEWGVPDQNVFFEAFGPATVKKAVAAPAPAEVAAAAALTVTFSKSGKTARWRPELSSLLDFADENGVKIEAGCRAGNCGTCLVAIKSGTVDYVTDPGSLPEQGSCLTCICKPKGDLVLDA